MIIMYLSLYPQHIPEGEPAPLALENLKYFIFYTESFLCLLLLCSKSLKHHISKRVVHFFYKQTVCKQLFKKKKKWDSLHEGHGVTKKKKRKKIKAYRKPVLERTNS